MTKEEILKEEYGKLIANPEKVYAQNPSIIKAAHSAMEIYAKEQMATLLTNISKQPVEVYSEKVRGQDKRYFLGRMFIENLIKRIK